MRRLSSHSTYCAQPNYQVSMLSQQSSIAVLAWVALTAVLTLKFDPRGRRRYTAQVVAGSISVLPLFFATVLRSIWTLPKFRDALPIWAILVSAVISVPLWLAALHTFVAPMLRQYLRQYCRSQSKAIGFFHPFVDQAAG